MPTPADQNFDTISGFLGNGSITLDGVTYFNTDPIGGISVTGGVLSLGDSTFSQTVVGFKTVDGSEFNLPSFQIWCDLAGNFSFSGYRDGVFVASFAAPTPGAGGFNVNMSSFPYIDEFRITAPDNSTIKIDTINFEPPIVSHVAPAIANLQGNSVFYTEGAAPSPIDAGSNATVTDTDTFTFSGGSLSASITGNRVDGEDVLGIATGSGVSLSGALANGVTVFVGATAIGTISSNGIGANALTVALNANATAVNVSTLLRAITYSNTNLANPSIAIRTVTTTFSDGDASSADATATSSVTVVSVNDAPVAVAGGTAASYTEGTPVVIDAALALSDVDSTMLAEATVQITGNLTAGDLLQFTNQNGISGSYDAGTGQLSLSGVASLANYQTALRSVLFNTGDNPGALDRTVTFSVNDGSAPSNAVTTVVRVTPVNDAPSATVPSAPIVYAENAAPAALESGLVVADPDSATLAFATVRITSGFIAGQDVLGFTASGGITGGYNAATGELVLLGIASVATYQTVLRSVTYSNSSDAPVTATRTIVFSANDGTATGTLATNTVTVTAVNDNPTASGVPTDVVMAEDATVGLGFLSPIVIADADALAGDTLNLQISTDGAGFFTFSGGATATSIVATGTLAELNAFLSSPGAVTYSPPPDANGNDIDHISIRVSDNGHNGSGGGGLIVVGTINIDVTAVNDSPVISALDDSIYTEGQAFGRLDADGSVLVSDAELDPLNGGNGDYTSATLDFARTGGADPDDSFGLNTSGASFTYGFDAGAGHDVLKVGGTIVADGPLVPGAGSFSLSFVNNGVVPTRALIEEVLSRITYANSSDDPPSSVSIDVTFNDANSGAQGAGGPGISVTPVMMTITPVNDAPTAADATITIEEDEDFGFGYMFDLSDFGFSDVEGHDFQSVTIVSAPLNGILINDATGDVLKAGDVIDAADIDNGDVYFVPDHDENGVGYASFDFQVTDDGGTARGGDDTSDTHTITFDVEAVNDAPRIRLQPGLDVVAAEPDSDGVAIASGDGNGLLYPAGGEFTGTQPEHVVLADFDGDGMLDIAVSNRGDDTVTILLGDACGCFTEAAGSPITVGDAPGGMDVGFIDNDLIPDLVVANTGDNTVTALLGNGDGTFTATTSTAYIFGTLADIALADFNEDGLVDIIAVGDSSITDNMRIAHGNGAGGFGLLSTQVPGFLTDIVDVETANLNGDLEADFIAVDQLNDLIFVRLGSGTLAFDAPGNLATGDAPQDAAIGDVNGDGFLDIVVANGGDDTVGVFLGNGAGAFSTQVTYEAGDGPSAIALADMNEDGSLDIVAGHEDGSLHVLLGLGDGSFLRDPDPLFSNFSVTDIAIGQIDPVAEETMPLLVSYTEGTPLVLAPRLELSDVDGALIEGATVFLDDSFGPGGLPGDVLSAVTTGTAITASYDPTTFVLTLSSLTPQPLADYQKVLRTVSFLSGDDPDDGGSLPLRIVGISVDDGTDEGFSAPILIGIVAEDDAPVAVADAFTVSEAATLGGDLFGLNPTTPDSDVDGPALAIAAVNGSSANVGTQITLASGALLTVGFDGTFDYDPGTAFARLPDFLASGASNTTATDSFTYTLAGSTTPVTVSITIRGADSGGDVLLGSAGIDALFGGTGDDTIFGSVGADVLFGGTSGVDNGVDTADYSASAAAVTVNLSTRNGLGGDAAGDAYFGIENVIGSSHDDTLTGNAAANALTGGGGADTLDGGAGADVLDGGLGNDTYVLGNGTDSVIDSGGIDTITSTVGRNLAVHAAIEHLTLLGSDAINGIGNGLANTITGNSGNNGLTGGGGADTLIGGLGDDTYFLANGTDSVTDTGGYDTIASTVSRSLAGHAAIERLVLEGATDINGYGNALDNRLYGNAGNNGLTGGPGHDRLYGGLGDDTYFLENGSDVVDDAGGNLDTIATTISRSLASYTGIERLILHGAQDIDGTGNGLANILIGNGGANTLDGGAGNDALTGGLGRDVLTGGFNADRFVFTSAADSGVGALARDVITDFVHAVDRIDLSAIDAIAGGANDAFTLLATEGTPFGGIAGQLRFFQLDYAENFRDLTLVEGDIDGNGAADFQIALTGLINLNGADFAL